jgi:thiamine biosynthesis lipoprotein
MSQAECGQGLSPTRREFVALGIGALVVASLPVALRGRGRGRGALARRSVPVMGTIADIAVVHRDPQHAQAAIDAAIAELRFVDRTMTRFSRDSDVGRANLGAASAPVALTPQTELVLEQALRWAEASDGAFDPCLARALELWDVGHRDLPPSAAEVSRLAGRGLYRYLELGRRAGAPVALFRDRDVGIDLGGIGKGYGVDRAVEALRAHGVQRGIVNVGGDLYAVGASEDGDPWKVGVRDPADPNGIIASFEVSDRAVATSGDYVRFFQYGGRRYHHILDPRTGEPSQSGVHSVTVMADDCMTADAAATAVFCRPDEAQRVLGRRAPAARLVHRA